MSGSAKKSGRDTVGREASRSREQEREQTEGKSWFGRPGADGGTER